MKSPGAIEKTLLAAATAGFFLTAEPDPEKLASGDLSTLLEMPSSEAQTMEQKKMLNALPPLQIGIAKLMISNIYADLKGGDHFITTAKDRAEAKRRQGKRVATAGLMATQANKLQEEKKKSVHTELKILYARTEDPMVFTTLGMPSEVERIEVDFIWAIHPQRNDGKVLPWMSFMLKNKAGNPIFKPVNIELKQ